MNIYIDEAGSFVPPKGHRRHSLVLALVVPGQNEPTLFYEFLRLRDSWPKQAVEIKGSKLDEDQAAQVIQLLASHKVIAEYYAIDMAHHPDTVIKEFKDRQAAEITANLTCKHSDSVVEHLNEQASSVRDMANPLFVQAFMTIHLMIDMLDATINYFAQRLPGELGRFAWTIDQKDRSLTAMEKLWSELMFPIAEARSTAQPFAQVEGFDYSHFAKYEIHEETADERWKRHLKWIRETIPSSDEPSTSIHCIDLKKVWSDERSFGDSKNSLGLQLADIAATTLCRALNGNIQQSGWQAISRLLIRRKTAPFMQLGRTAQQKLPVDPKAEGVWRALDAESQAMVLE